MYILSETRRRLVNDEGLCGVVYSPGYGMGLWNIDSVEERFEPEAVLAILERDEESFDKTDLAIKMGGAMAFEDYCVAWVSPGSAIYFEEFDGAESLDYTYIGEDFGIV